MTITDCFRILGIPRNAGMNDLKLAYRSKAKIYHPDRNGGDGRQFTRLHEAYTYLLDSGSFHGGTENTAGDLYKRETEEKLRREAHQKRAREEAVKRAAREKARKEADERAAFERKRKEMEKRAAERKAQYEEKIRLNQLNMAKERAEKTARGNSPSHKVFIAGEILSGSSTERQKKQAIHTLVSLKRKSAYPFLKKVFYNESEALVLLAIEAVGTLKIVQAGPELSSLICSGSVKIRMAVLEAIEAMGNKNNYSNIVSMAVRDNNSAIRNKAVSLSKRFYG